MGGVIPGILLGLSMMIFAYAIAKKRGFPVEPKASWNERGRSFLYSIPALLMPVIILGGICTATEAGAVACVYGFIVGVVTGELKLSKLPDILCDAAQTTAMVMMIMGASQIFGWLLTLEKIPSMLASAVQSVTSSPTGVFFLLMLVILFLGCFMTDAAVMLIMTPLMLPLVKSVGIDTVHFGVVINMMAVAGGLTPPVGNLLYIASNIAEIPVLKAIKGLVPFLIAIFAVMALCIFVPPLVTFLPNLLA
ncbi:MAG: TRAP transporter large permease [Oscillibacter sp.]|nr:TRAP transporter large permease [Oscillibacter sp.]